MQKIRKILRLRYQPTDQSNIEVLDFGLIWRPFRKISNSVIFFKYLALSLFYLYSPLTSCKISQKSFELFLRKLHYQPTNEPNIKVSDFGLIWRPFHEYLQISNFFQISSSVTFLPS